MTFRLIGPARINLLEVDLIGDGVPGAQVDFGVNLDGRNVGQFAFIPERTGVFDLIVRTRDERGCTAQTGVQRTIRVEQ